MDSDVDIGQQLGSYDLMKRLGHGGFADVYLGEHIILDGKRAAIKVLHTALAEQDKEAFRKEARRLVKLSHPHIVPIIDFALQESTGIPFLVMEYAENGSLHKRHERGEPLDRATIRCYMEQVAPALQYIHEQGLIHRDIKPANMLLGPNDTVWLSDVGIAVELATCTLTPSGTPAYMAPEQFEGKPCPASDQYALGVVVYEWLCGERPFKGSGEELEEQHKHTPPPPLRGRISNLPQEAALLVEAVVLRALAKKPEERFANVTEFADALRQALYPPPPILSEPLLIPSELSPILSEPLLIPSELSPTLSEPLSIPSEPSPVPSELSPMLSEPPSIPSELSPILSEPLSIPSELSPTLSEPLSIPSELSPTLSEPPSIPSELSPTLSEPPSIPSELSPILSEPLLIPSEPLLVQPVAPATQTEPVASPPFWSQRKRSLALICGVLLVLVLVQSAYYLISYRPYVEVTCNPAGFLEVQSVLFLSPLRAVKASDGHCVGVSDGRFAFDMKRPDAQIKSEAAEAFRQGNIKQAELKWQEALHIDTNDAEAGIYLQDQQVLSDTGHPYITFIVVTTLTGDDNAVNVGRDLLQGAYVAQREYNDAQSQYNDSPRLPNQVRVVLLVANVSRASPDCPDTCANSVVDQLVEAANGDQHIKGIIGWPAVGKGQGSTALKKLTDAGLPVISTTSSDWAGVPSSFFHVAPTLEDQANTAVHYATSHWQIKTAALFSDSNNSYSSTLANDFKQAFVKAGGRIVYAGLYRADHAGGLKDSLRAGLLVHPDLIYFAGNSRDASDFIKQLRQLTASPPPIMGGDALYRPGSYSPDALYRLENLYFTASAFPDVWGSFLQVREGCKSGPFQPVFFCHYIQYFDPQEKHLDYPYGYMRPDSGVILAYDATLTFFSASSQLLSGDNIDFPLQALRQTLSQIQIQGISGLINFTSSTSKAVVVLRLRDGKNGFAGARSQSLVGSFFCPPPIEVGMPCS